MDEQMHAHDKNDMRGELFQVWDGFTENEKEELLPILVDSTQGWHEWAINPSGCLAWLESNFHKAGVAFPITARPD